MKYSKGLRYAIVLTATTALGAVACSDNNGSNPDSGVAGRSGTGGSGVTGTGGGGHAGSGGVSGTGGVLGSGGAGGKGGSATGGAGGTGGAFAGGGHAGGGGIGGGGRGATGGAAGNGGAGGAGGAAGATEILTDGQIIAILLEANAGEVHTADVADVRATDGDVQTFSAQLRADHTAAELRLNALVQSDGFIVSDSGQRQMVADMANDAVNALWMAPMAEFNRGFVQAQIMLHASVLDLIDEVLLPQVSSTALRSEVQSERNAVSIHLDVAHTLAMALDNSSGAGGAP